MGWKRFLVGGGRSPNTKKKKTVGGKRKKKKLEEGKKRGLQELQDFSTIGVSTRVYKNSDGAKPKGGLKGKNQSGKRSWGGSVPVKTSNSNG